MAILDTSADNIRITTYDTSSGAAAAAAQAVADGNRLILGPMLADNVEAVRGEAARAGIPLISFSNNTSVARPDVFVMGHIPEQSITRSVAYARSRGAVNFAALLPNGDYGDRAASALDKALADYGGLLAQTQRYNRGSSAVIGAATRMRETGGYDTVLIADGVQLASQAANALRDDETGAPPKLIGTELWSGESAVTRTSALRGAIFSAVSNQRFQRFRDSYQNRFGGAPYRISTLGYDAVLLTLRVARDWQVGRPFPTRQLTAGDGFLGLDGAFRFKSNGVIERAMEVREVREGNVVVVDAAPARFED
jgi:ABC-type branched-subunit amino acid transport system substrate-binding protein